MFSPPAWIARDEPLDYDRRRRLMLSWIAMTPNRVVGRPVEAELCLCRAYHNADVQAALDESARGDWTQSRGLVACVLYPWLWAAASAFHVRKVQRCRRE